MFHRGDLSVKVETGSVKGETTSANFGQGKVQIYRQFYRDTGDVTSVSSDLSVKRETGSVKGETISANFRQGKVQIYRQF